LRKKLRDFYRVFQLPLSRNTQKRDKNKIAQNKTEEKKATFFVMGPDGTFEKRALSCF
jgi:hypothetical protein